MLPFLKQKPQTGVIVHTRKPDADKAPASDEVEGLEVCIHDAISAYKANDFKKLAKHIKDLHDVLHSYMDSDSSESNDYHSQNEKAAQSEQD